MFQTGSQINPSLGRTDYSAYAQGAIAGGQAIGQGIANLAQGFANGIEKYQKKKEEKQKLDEATSFIGNLLKRNPQLAANFNLTPDENGNFDEGAIRSAAKVVGPAPFLQLEQSLKTQADTTASQNRVSQFILEQNKQEQANRGLGEATPEGVLSGPAYQAAPIPKLTAIEEVAGMKALSALRQDEANLAETRAKTLAATTPKPPNLSFQEQQLETDTQAFVDQYKRQPTSTEKSKIMGAIARAPAETPLDPIAGAVLAQQVPIIQKSFDSAESVPASIASIHQQKDLINSGQVPTGILSTIESSFNLIGALLGNKSAEADVARTAEYDKLLSKTTFNAMQASGLRATQLNTEKEWERFNKAIAAGRENPKEAALAVLDLNEKAERAVLEQHNKNRKQGKFNRFLNNSLIDYSEIEMPPEYSFKKSGNTINVGGTQLPSPTSLSKPR